MSSFYSKITSKCNIILVLRGFASHADVILHKKCANIYIYLVYKEAFLDVKCKKTLKFLYLLEFNSQSL